MFDLIISGGIAVMPAATAAADIGVAGGKIAAIGAPGASAPRHGCRRDGPDRHSRRDRSAYPLRRRSSFPGQQRRMC